jgi:hypothetical protein
LPHSEIHGSRPACGSPWLIATCYVLHRLLAPRHSPQALSSLIAKSTAVPLPGRQTQRSPNCLFLCSCLCAVVKERARGRSRAPGQNRLYRPVVGVTGFEPVTLRLSSACSNQLSYTPALRSSTPARSVRVGGAEEIRTPDLQLAKLPLCQLSYSPTPDPRPGRGSTAGPP